MWFDSHFNIHHFFDEEREKVINRAKEYYVNKFVCVCDSLQNSTNIYDLIYNRDGMYMTLGEHPCSNITYNDYDSFERIFMNFYNKYKNKVVAVGETGLDFYKSNQPNRYQIRSFDYHARIACKLKLPLLIHSRKCEKEIVDFFSSRIEEFNKNNIKVLMHCFTLSRDIVDHSIKEKWDFYFSFTGIITFDGGISENIIRRIPISNILIETDAPFLSPVPYRGQCNEPMLLPIIGNKVAEIKKEKLKKIRKILWNNSHSFFQLNNFVNKKFS